MRLGPSIRALRQLLRLNSDAHPGGKPSIGSAPESLPPEGVFRPRLRVGDDEGHLAPARTPLGPEVCTCCKERPQLEDVLLLVCIPCTELGHRAPE